MSVRRTDTCQNHDDVQKLRSDIASVLSSQNELEFDSLNETEKSAATIGVSPDAWRPIAFMNQAHYGELLRNNALSGRLTQQVEAFKTVAGQ
jgi:hypothetical protein